MSHRRRVVRGTFSVLAAAALTLVSIPAWAHVEVEANRAYAGATHVTVTFHVPNELAPATTRDITFVFPTDHPLLGVTAASQNGFTPTLSSVPLAKAVRGPNGWVREVVRTVEFSGGQLSGKQEKAFTFHVDQLPSDTRTLTFKVLQKYSTGETVSWIEVAADGAAEPEHPAPVLALGPARGGAQPNDNASPTLAVTLGTKASTAPRAASGSAATSAGMKAPVAAAAVGGFAVTAGGWALWRRRRTPGDAT
jgi:uncharacterized protein YcnI